MHRGGWSPWLLLCTLTLTACPEALNASSGEERAEGEREVTPAREAQSPERAPVAPAEAAPPARRPSGPMPCFLDDGTPAGEALAPEMHASRLRGVAPLAVFFDTRGTRAEGEQRPFHELAYCWDFGDPASGTYETDGRARNRARGPVAAHVFERPGTYHVVLVVRDAAGRTARIDAQVRVEDPDRVFAGARTTCFSGSGEFEGCPSGARHVRASSLASLARSVARGRRLLLHRGETFEGAAIAVDVPGPGSIGAYGPSDAPPPRVAWAGGLFTLSGPEHRLSDWRIADIDFDGRGAADSYFVRVDGGARDLLLLGDRAHHVGTALMAANSIVDYWNAHGHPGNDVVDVLVVQDVDFGEVVGGGGHDLGYVAAHRFALLGSRMLDSTAGEHVLRMPWVDRGVLSSNEMGLAPSPRHVLKIHAPGFDAPGVGHGRFTEEVVISDNVFRGRGGSDWTVAVGPQNETSDERVRDLRVERNLFLPGEAAQVALLIWARDVTVGDNVFVRGAFPRCVVVGRRGIEPAPEAVALVHNTCVSDVATRLVEVGEGASDVTAFDNLVVGSREPSVGVASGPDAGNVVTTAPGFLSGDRQRLEGYVPGPRSPALHAARGRGLYTPWDAFGQPRPVGRGSAAADVGALEPVP